MNNYNSRIWWVLNHFTNDKFSSSLDLLEGKTFENIYNGKEHTNKFGKFFIIEELDFKFKHLNYTKSKFIDAISDELELVKGISKDTKKMLKEEGLNKIQDLITHKKHSKNAKEVLEILSLNKLEIYFNNLKKGFSKSHRVRILGSLLVKDEDIVYVDIETLGLSDSPVFLIGLGYFVNGESKFIQLIARNLEEEKSMLLYFSEFLSSKKAIYSFNGKSFDMPFIKNRLNYYSLNSEFNQLHFDILFACRLHFTPEIIVGFENIRPRKTEFKKIYSNFQGFTLQSLEKQVLKFDRGKDVPGFLIPEIYSYYLVSKNIAFLLPIIEHNKIDILTTMKLRSFLIKLLTK